MNKKQINIGINGCGRIAKCLIRIIDKDPVFNLISINHYNKDLSKLNVINYINYDSIHSKFQLKKNKCRSNETFHTTAKKATTSMQPFQQGMK